MPYRIDMDGFAVECDTTEEVIGLYCHVRAEGLFMFEPQREQQKQPPDAPRIAVSPPPAVAQSAPQKMPQSEITNDSTNPVEKRKSPHGEAIPSRAERILLVLNQLGPISMEQLALEIGKKLCTTRYALEKTAVVVSGMEGYAACRVSAFWTAEDEAMFGAAKLALVGWPYGKEAREMLERGEIQPSDDYKEQLKTWAKSSRERETADEEETDAAETDEDDDDEEAAEEDTGGDPQPVKTKTEKWLNSDDSPNHTGCDLCDGIFKNNERILIATDYHGTKIMCQPCARRAGHSVPAKKAQKEADYY